MNNEETIIDPQYTAKSSSKEVKNEAKQEEKKPEVKKESRTGERVAFTAGGAVFGAAATMAGQAFASQGPISEKPIEDGDVQNEPAPEPTQGEEQKPEQTTVPSPEDSPNPEEAIVITDEGIRVAHVDDDMTFSEAFAEARAQVGAGGVFEWHGKVYGTYYKSEWDNMSAEEHHEWQSSIDYTDVTSQESHDYSETQSHSGSDEHSDTHANEGHYTQTTTSQAAPQPTPVSSGATSGSDDIEVEVLDVAQTDLNGDGVPEYSALVSVNGQEVIIVDIDQNGTADVLLNPYTGEAVAIEEPNVPMPTMPGQSSSSDPQLISTDDQSQTGGEPDVQIIAFGETDLNGDGYVENTAVLSVNGEEALLVDVNIDGKADVLINPNSGEVYDITQENIAMPMDDGDTYLAQNDAPDYMNDANVDDFA